MKSVAFFGKGGIGKSTLSSNISAVLGRLGHRVLHAGCDPKMDSSLALTGRNITPFSAAGMKSEEHILRSMIVPSPYVKGVYCVEAGGPEPGLGCAGVAIGTLLDAIRAEGLTEDGTYDRMVFDVLGDVVCGGFAAPLKKGFAKKAVIVTSEEILSLYAANNLLRMMRNYARNGVYAAGLALNIRDRREEVNARRYAEAVGLPVLGTVYRDEAVYEAAKSGRPAVLDSPKSEFARGIVRLALAIEKAERPAGEVIPLNEAEFAEFAAGKQIVRGSGTADVKQYVEAALPEKLTQGYIGGLNLRLYGLEGGNVLFEYQGRRKTEIIVITPAAAGRGGTVRRSDWSAYVKPETGEDGKMKPGTGEMGAEIQEALKGLEYFRYREILGLACGSMDKPYYGTGGADSHEKNYTDILPGITGNPQMVSHALPYPVSGVLRRDKYSFFILDRSSTPNPVYFLVDHADRECRFNGGTCGGMLGRYNLLRNRGIRQPLLPASGISFASSDFNLRDSLTGSTRSLQRCLNTAFDNQPGGNTVLELDIGCSPLMLSTEVSDFIDDNFDKRHISVEDIHCVYENGAAQTENKINLLTSKLKEAFAVKDKGASHYDVCLSDFGHFSESARKLLEKKGITTICQNSYSSTEPVYAGVQVLFNSGSIKKEAFRRAGLRTADTHCLPFGFRNTEKWLSDIFKSVCDERHHAGFDSMPLPAEIEKKKKLSTMLSCAGAAFIIDAEEIKFILSENPDYPASLAYSFLIQSEIPVTVFVNLSGLKEEGRKRPETIPDSSPYLRFTGFGSVEELDKMLCADKNIRIVYSDIRDDPRLLNIGKQPFSSDILEAGYEGAVETLRRLAELSGVCV